MATHFREAAQRHHTDASLLLDLGRLGGADHLYGLSAECALKAILVGLGVIPSAGPPSGSPYRKHIDKLWAEFALYVGASGRPAYSLPAQNPFADWRVEQRYHEDAFFTDSVIRPHQAGSDTTSQLIQQAVLNGDLT